MSKSTTQIRFENEGFAQAYKRAEMAWGVSIVTTEHQGVPTAWPETWDNGEDLPEHYVQGRTYAAALNKLAKIAGADLIPETLLNQQPDGDTNLPMSNLTNKEN